MAIESLVQSLIPNSLLQGSGLQAGGVQQSERPDQSIFAEKLSRAMRSVDNQQHHADDLLSQLASGENVDIHGTMIAMEKADIALRTAVSVRDKLVDAYQQVMNMSV